MNISTKSLIVSGVILLTAFCIVGSCGKQAPTSVPAKANEAPAKVAIPENLAALVTFISGRVERIEAGKQQAVDIGDNLPVKTIMHVYEDSYCELQFGNTALLRVNEGSEISLEKVVLETTGNQIEARLASGSVYAKVAKLASKDKFQIRTQVAVCGVRGTEFSVSAGKTGNTILKVKEGKVAVVPTAAEAKLAELGLPQTSATADLAEAASSSLMQAAPVVAKDHEVEITLENSAKTEEVLKGNEKELAAIISSISSSPNQQEDAIKKITESISQKAFVAIAAPAPISAESTQELAVINAMKFVSLPEKAPAPDAAKQEPAPIEKKKLSSISIAVTPSDAEIYLNGSLVAVGSLQQVVEEDATQTFLIKRTGYEQQELTTQAKTSKAYDVKLTPKPKDISIAADPADAEILIDGQSVGTGNYKGTFEVGKEITIGLKKAGYSDKTIKYSVTIDSQPEISISLNKTTKEVTVKATPSDAKIFIADKLVSTGSYKTLGNVGDKIQFKVARSGYIEKTVSLSVQDSDTNIIEVELDRLKKTITITAEPADSKIALNGGAQFVGKASETYPYGTVVTAQVSRDGYETQNVSFTIGDNTRDQSVVRLQKPKKIMTINAVPKESTISIGGRFVGVGTYQAEVAVGDSFEVTIQGEGYYEKKASISIDANFNAPLRFELEAKPIIARIKTASSKIVGMSVSDGGWIFISDSAGTISAFDELNKPVWSVQTANKPNETTPPVLIGDSVYFSGTKELVIIDSRSGTMIAKKPLDSSSSNLFGRRPIGIDGHVYLPTNQAILEIDPSDGKTLRTIKLNSDSMMTPAYAQGKFFIADQTGKVYSINYDTGAEAYTIATQGLQCVAQAIQINNSIGCFAGRKGNIVSFDISTGKILWQTKLDDPNAAVFSDLVLSSNKILVFSRNTIYALNSANGQPLVAPIKEVSAPPILVDDTIYYGTIAGEISAFNVASNSTKSVKLGSKPTTQVLKARKSYFALGTETGELVVINPQGIK